MASADQVYAPTHSGCPSHQSSIPDIRSRINNYHALVDATAAKPQADDSAEYYSFPRTRTTPLNPPSLSFPSLLAATTTTPARPSVRALEAAASLSALLSNPKQPHEKWQEHHERIIEAILPPKGFDSVTVQLPPRTLSLDTAQNPTSPRPASRRPPVPKVRGSASRRSSTLEGYTPLTESALAAWNATSSGGVGGAINEENPATGSPSRRRRTSKPADEKVVQAATAAAAIAAGNTAGTTGAIASAAAAAAALCQEEQELSRREATSAFTLLCVDDDVVSCKIMSKICEKWGQPYETVTSGAKALELYKTAPEKYRCILMDIVMPGQDGFETTKLIRQFEESSWTNEEDPKVLAANNGNKTAVEGQQPEKPNTPVRRAVIIGMAVRSTPPPPMEVIKEGGFDLVVEKPLHLRLLSELLFSGPETNAVAVYGAVDPESLRQAGYPLRMRPLRGQRRPPLDNVFGSSFG
ncbi:hypothetical protein Micbo1qcDRAFT_160012 [Microdochium bolleyi]|uniref:Response regulatory domain-containing protein n=1 Tax=Microdochium bolleyi TaxID=196109 RepID=A0A136JC91_9PEZI|nr:hypothetical protein Micbo1qcDRAFT_160012 [Microdochium bolleyi]